MRHLVRRAAIGIHALDFSHGLLMSLTARAQADGWQKELKKSSNRGVARPPELAAA